MRSLPGRNGGVRPGLEHLLAHLEDDQRHQQVGPVRLPVHVLADDALDDVGPENAAREKRLAQQQLTDQRFQLLPQPEAQPFIRLKPLQPQFCADAHAEMGELRFEAAGAHSRAGVRIDDAEERWPAMPQDS